LENYHKEMKIVIIKVDMVEDRETNMARFLNDMNREITCFIELLHYVKLEDMVHMAIEWRCNLKGRGMYRQLIIQVLFHYGN